MPKVSPPPGGLNLSRAKQQQQQQQQRQPQGALPTLSGAKKPKPKPKPPAADDYPPLVPEVAPSSLFSELGFTAKPTFAKPKQQQQQQAHSNAGGLSSKLTFDAANEDAAPAWHDDDDLDGI